MHQPQTPPLSRRRFICHGMGAWAAAQLPSLHARDANLTPVEATRHALGARVHIQVLAPDTELAHSAIGEAFAAIEAVEQRMSLYRPNSEISRLNRHGKLRSPSASLRRVLQTATRLARRSEGAFDITIQPLWDLYHQAKQSNTPPSRAERDEALDRVDWNTLRLEEEQVTLTRPGSAITLNGIAQGVAADQAQAALRRSGIEHAIVDCGELAPLGRKAENHPWQVGIQHPRDPDAFAALIPMTDRCLATSGDYETRFSDDFTLHHILDPRTGQSPPQLASVTVAAPTATLADALSTTLLILGIKTGFELMAQFDNVDALAIMKNGERRQSPGFPSGG